MATIDTEDPLAVAVVAVEAYCDGSPPSCWGRGVLASLAIEEVALLAAISVRNLDDQVKERLRIRAARHGRSMEAEIRAILMDAVREPDGADGLFQTMLDRFGKIGGVELELPPRATPVRAADLAP